MTKHNDQERALFEAFAKQIRDTVGEDDDAGCQDMSLDRQGGCYVCPETYAAWLAWQARAQLPAGGTIPEPVEIAAFLMEPDMYEPYVSLSRDSRCNGSVEPLMTVTQHNRIVAQLSAAPHPVSDLPTCEIAQVADLAGLIVSDVCDLPPEDDGADCVRVNVNDLIAIIKRHLAPHPVSGEQKPASVQITGHLDEVDAPVWEFINAEARKLGPATGSIDTYNFARPNGAQPNGVVAVLWSGASIHAMAVTVRDSMNRTQCVRLLANAPTWYQTEADIAQHPTIKKIDAALATLRAQHGDQQ